MARKRKAATDLNEDNWDKEDIPEEKGTFNYASEDILKKRKILTARRTLPTSAATGLTNANTSKYLFGSFNGLIKSEVSPGDENAFSFLSKISNTMVASSSSGTIIEDKVKESNEAKNSAVKLKQSSFTTKNPAAWTKGCRIANNSSVSPTIHETYSTELPSLNSSEPSLHDHEKALVQKKLSGEESIALIVKESSKLNNDVVAPSTSSTGSSPPNPSTDVGVNTNSSKVSKLDGESTDKYPKTQG